MMIQQKTVLSLALFLSFLFSGCSVKNPDVKEIKIAFISDVHLQDIVDHPILVRTMQSQVTSTRLFNENYFALLAALEDVVSKDIKLVVFPGDLTDDGQVVNQLAVRKILNEYSTRHGLRFLPFPETMIPPVPMTEKTLTGTFSQRPEPPGPFIALRHSSPLQSLFIWRNFKEQDMKRWWPVMRTLGIIPGKKTGTGKLRLRITPMKITLLKKRFRQRISMHVVTCWQTQSLPCLTLAIWWNQ